MNCKQILLILGEISSKGSNLKSLSLIDVFAELAEVNTKALNIKNYECREEIAKEVRRQNLFSYSYLAIPFVDELGPEYSHL